MPQSTPPIDTEEDVEAGAPVPERAGQRPAPAVASRADPRRLPHGGTMLAPAAPTLPSRLEHAGSGYRLDVRDGTTLQAVLAGADLVPDERPGSRGGYRVRSLDSAGYLAAAGVARGDVLVAVNDHPTLNADQALDAYAAARGARHLVLRFRRGAAEYSVPVELVR